MTSATIDVAANRAGPSGVIQAHYYPDIQRWKTAEQVSEDRLDAAYEQARTYAGEPGEEPGG
jgi:hypothetical protein